MINDENSQAPASSAPSSAAQRSRAAAKPRVSRGGGRTARNGLSVAPILGFSLALITLILDQATKIYAYRVLDLPINEPIVLTPFLKLIVVWNRGISYGLFQQDGDLGRWVLIIVSILAAIGLSVWIRRTRAKLLAASLGLIVGGAIGNVIDRLWYGAVFDFIQFHVGDWSWYVFNVADAAIVAGVIGLLYDSFVLEGRRGR
ncbi:signal peptidase II [Microvirga sp. TS319]